MLMRGAGPESAAAKPVTFRKPQFAAFGWFGVGFLTIAFGVVSGVAHSAGLFAVAVLFAAFVYVIWLIGCHSAVRLNQDGVIVDNFLVRHVIPWGELAAIAVDNGLCFRLRDGRKIGSMTYAGSLAGALLGYRYTEMAADRMRAARDQLLAGMPELPASPGYCRRIGFSVWPPLVILAVMEAIAGLSVLLG